jgi:hypothetical protein
MRKSKTSLVCLVIAVAVCVLTYGTVHAAAKITKSVTAMEGGNYLIKLNVTASGGTVYALQLIDPKGGIVDVYAPKGWCVVTDGGDYLARTGSKPIAPGKSIEFLIHSSTDEINYTYTVFGRLKQLGKPGTI